MVAFTAGIFAFEVAELDAEALGVAAFAGRGVGVATLAEAFEVAGDLETAGAFEAPDGLEATGVLPAFCFVAAPEAFTGADAFRAAGAADFAAAFTLGATDETLSLPVVVLALAGAFDAWVFATDEALPVEVLAGEVFEDTFSEDAVLADAVLLVTPLTRPRADDAAARVALELRFTDSTAFFVFAAAFSLETEVFEGELLAGEVLESEVLDDEVLATEVLETEAAGALARPLFATLLADFLSDTFGSAAFFLSGMAHSLTDPRGMRAATHRPWRGNHLPGQAPDVRAAGTRDTSDEQTDRREAAQHRRAKVPHPRDLGTTAGSANS